MKKIHKNINWETFYFILSNISFILSSLNLSGIISFKDLLITDTGRFPINIGQ